jgi:hypothetical protein
MVTHLKQIYDILYKSITTYTINTNTQQAIAPSINISYMKPEKPHYATKDEIYQLHIKATSVENREAIVNILFQLDTRYPNGYNISDPLYEYITANFDSVKTALVYTLLTDTGKLGLTIGPVTTTHKALIQAEFEPISITSLSLLLTPDGTTAGALTGYIYAKATNYTISSVSDWLAAVDAIEDDDLKDTIDISTWTDDSENSYTLANISAGVAGTQTQIAFYITVQNAFATKTFDAARIKVLLGTTDYPYWIDVQIKNKAYNTNEFMAELELTARWAL